MTEHTLFCVSPHYSQRFIERPLGDDVALFDTLSGETHLIPSSALTVVELLNPVSMNRVMLHKNLAPYVNGTEEEIGNFLDRTLQELSEIGLIEVTVQQ